jgi:hypothetical protein
MDNKYLVFERFASPIAKFIDGYIIELNTERWPIDKMNNIELIKFYRSLINGQTRLIKDEGVKKDVTDDQINRFNAAAEATKSKLAKRYDLKWGDIIADSLTEGGRSKRPQSKRAKSRSRSKRPQSKRAKSRSRSKRAQSKRSRSKRRR